MAFSLSRLGLRVAAFNLERTASVLLPTCVIESSSLRKQFNTQGTCNGTACYLEARRPELAERPGLRRYSKGHRRPDTRQDSDSDSDAECGGLERSEFWRRKMRTVHDILDVDRDGLVSFSDFTLLAARFAALGHLTKQQTEEFDNIIKLTWEELWGPIDPYNYVTVEQYLEDMQHALADKTLTKRLHRWLPYLFKAVDKDGSGSISVQEFELFFRCAGRAPAHAALAFAAIDVDGDGKLSLEEFVSLGEDFFKTEDPKCVSKMFWGPLVDA